MVEQTTQLDDEVERCALWLETWPQRDLPRPSPGSTRPHFGRRNAPPLRRRAVRRDARLPARSSNQPRRSPRSMPISLTASWPTRRAEYRRSNAPPRRSPRSTSAAHVAATTESLRVLTRTLADSTSRYDSGIDAVLTALANLVATVEGPRRSRPPWSRARRTSSRSSTSSAARPPGTAPGDQRRHRGGHLGDEVRFVIVADEVKKLAGPPPSPQRA